jgi:hypothetical protein
VQLEQLVLKGQKATVVMLGRPGPMDRKAIPVRKANRAYPDRPVQA